MHDATGSEKNETSKNNNKTTSISYVYQVENLCFCSPLISKLGPLKAAENSLGRLKYMTALTKLRKPTKGLHGWLANMFKSSSQGLTPGHDG